MLARRTILLLIGSILAIFTLVGSILYLTSTLWFYSALLPDSKYAATVGFADNKIPALVPEAAYKQITGLDKDNEVISLFGSYIVAKQAQEQQVVIIGVPTIKGQFRVKGVVANNGWIYQRLGHIVVIQMRDKENAENVAFETKSILLRYWLKLAANNWTINPAAILSVSRSYSETVDAEYDLYASVDDNAIEITGRRSDGSKIGSKTEDYQTLVKPEGDLYIKSAGSYVDKIPEHISANLERQLTSSLGLGHTVIQFSALLRQQNQIIVSVNDNVTIAGQGFPNEFRQEIIAAVSNENAHLNPVKKAFKLPDGTLGYEYVPGEVDTQVEVGEDGCAQHAYDGHSIWLCEGNNSISASNSRDSAKNNINLLDQYGWQISINKPYINELNLSGISSLNAAGGDDYFRVVISTE